MTNKRRGRPPIDPDDPSTDVHLRLPSKDYDAAHSHATRRGVSVPELIRRTLAKNLSGEFRDLK
jgi:predicted DNA binding CopG/RHH family protein